MAAPTRKELQLVLKVTTDPDGSGKRGMDQVAAAAERAERASSKAQRAAMAGAGVAGARGVTGVVGGTAAPAAGGGMGGYGAAIAGRFGIPTGMAGPAAAAAAAYQVVRTGKTAADAFQDELLTGNQRARLVAKSLPFGETALSFTDTLTGRGRDMARAGEEGERASAVSAARTQFLGTQLGLQAGVSSSQAQANALAGARAATVPYIDRSTAVGERQFRLESQLSQVRERGAAADREAAAARDEAADADQRSLDLARKGEQIDQRRAEAQRRVDASPAPREPKGLWGGIVENFTFTPAVRGVADTEGPNRARQFSDLDRTAGERQAITQMQAEQLRTVQEARVRQIAAEGRSRSAQASVLGVQAADFEDRATRASSNAQRVALSSRDRVQEAIYAAERFKRGGLRSLDPSELSLLQEFGGDDVRAAAERDGKNDPRTRRLAGLLPQTFQDGAADPETFRRQANENRNRQAELQIEIERDTATATAGVVRTVAETIERVLIRALDEVERNFLNRQRGARGAQ